MKAIKLVSFSLSCGLLAHTTDGAFALFTLHIDTSGVADKDVLVHPVDWNGVPKTIPTDSNPDFVLSEVKKDTWINYSIQSRITQKELGMCHVVIVGEPSNEGYFTLGTWSYSSSPVNIEERKKGSYVCSKESLIYPTAVAIGVGSAALITLLAQIAYARKLVVRKNAGLSSQHDFNDGTMFGKSASTHTSHSTFTTLDTGGFIAPGSDGTPGNGHDGAESIMMQDVVGDGNIREIYSEESRDAQIWEEKYGLDHYGAGCFFGALVGWLAVNFIAMSINAFLLSSESTGHEATIKIEKSRTPDGADPAVYQASPTGDLAMSERAVSFLGPNGWTMLLPEEMESNPERIKEANANGLPASFSIPGTPTSVEACYDGNEAVTKLFVGGTKGAKLFEINPQGQITGQSKTIFVGSKVRVISTPLDNKQKKCSAVLDVQNTDSKNSKILLLKNTGPALSFKTAERDFATIKDSNFDGFGNGFYSDQEEHPKMAVIQKEDASETFVDAGLPEGAQPISPISNLPNGHMLAFTTNGVFYSNPKGIFSLVPKDVLKNEAYNDCQLVQEPSILDKDRNQKSFTLICFPKDPIAAKAKGLREIKMPMSGNEETIEKFEARDLFADKYFVDYSYTSSVLTVADKIETLAQEGQSAQFTQLSQHYLSPQKSTLDEVIGGSYGPDEKSPDVFFALKEKGILLVDRKTGNKKVLHANEHYTAIHNLPKEGQMLFVAGHKIQIANAHGGNSGVKNELVFSAKINQTCVLAGKGDGSSQIVVGTTEGLYVLTKQKNADVYSIALTLFQDEDISSVDFTSLGKLVFTSQNFPKGFASETDLSQLEQTQSPELMFAAL